MFAKVASIMLNYTTKNVKSIIWIALFSILLSYSCKKDNFYTGSDKVLKFSTDTVQFDTVFTTIGSATQSFIV